MYYEVCKISKKLFHKNRAVTNTIHYIHNLIQSRHLIYQAFPFPGGSLTVCVYLDLSILYRPKDASKVSPALSPYKLFVNPTALDAGQNRLSFKGYVRMATRLYPSQESQVFKPTGHYCPIISLYIYTHTHMQITSIKGLFITT